MKKFLLLSMLLAMMSLNVLAVVPEFTTTGGIKISKIQGYFSRIDTCVAELTDNRFKFVESQTIPSITIDSKEYPGYLNEENTRIYWPIGITADDVLPTGETSAKQVRLSYNILDVKVIDFTDNSEGTIGSTVAGPTTFLKVSKNVVLSKYQPIKYIIVSAPSTEFDVISPSKLSDPTRGSSKKLYGKYEVRIDTGNSNDYLISSFTPDKNFDSTTPLAQAIVVKEDGTEVARFDITKESENTFSTFIDHPITDDGNYYIVYDFPGIMQVYVMKDSGTYPYHLAPIKMGPYTVDSNSAEKFVPGTAVSQPFASTIYTDDLPSEWRVEIKNANSTFQAEGSELSAVELLCVNASDTIKVKPEIRFENKEVVISLKELNDEILKQASPAKNYTLRIPTIYKFISGTTDNGETITFPKSRAISTTYNLSVPAPAGSLNAYVKHPADELELGEGEEISLKLGTENIASHQIFFRWTPEESTVYYNSRATETDEDDFIEHTGDITIAGPGTLEYYTRLSNTTSEVKSIRVVAKEPDGEDPDISTGLNKISSDTCEEGAEFYYRLDGTRATNLASPGIYICKSPSGTTRKVLVK